MDRLNWPDCLGDLDAGVVVSVLALVVTLIALAFAILSFWWLNARRGEIEVARPISYVFSNTVRLRLPLAFFNTGAVALIVADLRVLVDSDGTREPMPWIAVLPNIRRSDAEGDVSEFATPFTVPGRGAHRVVVEFGDSLGWSPEPVSQHMLRVQAKVHPVDAWRDVGSFDWWAPPDAATMGLLLTYRNAAVQDPGRTS